MKLRGCYKPFLDHIRSYYKELFKGFGTSSGKLRRDQVIMMQVENEYGYYG